MLVEMRYLNMEVTDGKSWGGVGKGRSGPAGFLVCSESRWTGTCVSSVVHPNVKTHNTKSEDGQRNQGDAPGSVLLLLPSPVLPRRPRNEEREVQEIQGLSCMLFTSVLTEAK